MTAPTTTALLSCNALPGCCSRRCTPHWSRAQTIFDFPGEVGWPGADPVRLTSGPNASNGSSVQLAARAVQRPSERATVTGTPKHSETDAESNTSSMGPDTSIRPVCRRAAWVTPGGISSA